MCAPLVSKLQELEATGINAYDAAIRETVLVVAPVMCAKCDNPQHSEIMNHLGPSASNCRICMVRIIMFTQLHIYDHEHIPCSSSSSMSLTFFTHSH